MSDRGLLVVLSGPSGSGKGAVRTELIQRQPGVSYAVSATTRPPRSGETDGEDYYFLSPEQFEQWIRQDRLVEWADVYGNLYGTPREPMETRLQAGQVVLVEKDVVGARTLMDRYPDAVFVFIMPPSIAELRARLQSRGTDSDDAVRRRLSAVTRELEQVRRYDYVVVNDDLTEAARLLKAIIDAEQCRVWRVGRQQWRSL